MYLLFSQVDRKLQWLRLDTFSAMFSVTARITEKKAPRLKCEEEYKTDNNFYLIILHL